jgi:hypothetical protein
MVEMFTNFTFSSARRPAKPSAVGQEVKEGEALHAGVGERDVAFRTSSLIGQGCQDVSIQSG